MTVVNQYSLIVNKLAIIVAVFMVTLTHGYKECSPSEDVCEFWLTVEEQLTMTWKRTRVHAVNGVLYKYDEMPSNSTITVR